MSNQKATELRRIYRNQLSRADLVSLVDVSSLISPTGENVSMTIGDFLGAVSDLNLLDVADSLRAPRAISTGLHFLGNTMPGTETSKKAIAKHEYVSGTDLFIGARVVLPKDQTVITATDHRVIFGLTTAPNGDASRKGNSAYIAIASSSLVGYVAGNTGDLPTSIVRSNNFIDTYGNSTTFVGVSKQGATMSLYIGANCVASGVLDVSGSIFPSGSQLTAVMGNGTTGSLNLDVIIGEAIVLNHAVTENEIGLLAAGCATPNMTGITSLYTEKNLNPIPSQWLDSVGENHILLPVDGAVTINTAPNFKLSFSVTSSDYLGGQGLRNVLPENSVLTHCILTSDGKPLLSVGTSDLIPPVSASATGSWVNNVVPFVSASYGVNNLNIASLGATHESKSLYVHFSASAAPCKLALYGFTT